MEQTKFYDIPTEQGNITININNVASIENTTRGTRIIMDTTDETGKNIVYITKLSWITVSSNITSMDKNQK